MILGHNFDFTMWPQSILLVWTEQREKAKNPEDVDLVEVVAEVCCELWTRVSTIFWFLLTWCTCCVVGGWRCWWWEVGTQTHRVRWYLWQFLPLRAPVLLFKTSLSTFYQRVSIRERKVNRCPCPCHLPDLCTSFRSCPKLQKFNWTCHRSLVVWL